MVDGKSLPETRSFTGVPSLPAMHVEIENFFPHRREEAQMTLLAGVFLRDLQLDGFVCFFQPAEQWRYRLARLEIDRAVLDLDDDVVVELAVERMEIVIGGLGAVVLGVAPIEMMVVDKRAIENDSAVRLESARDDVGGVGGGAMIGLTDRGGLRSRLSRQIHRNRGSIA